MRSIVVFAALAAVVTLAAGAPAQPEPDHAAHHPGGASAPAAAVRKAPAKAKPKAAPAAASAGMGGDMQQMHDQMHGKHGQMMGAQPPASAASK